MTKKFRVVVCRGPECGDHRASRAIHTAFQAELAARRLEGQVELAWQSCFGRCRQGPNVLVHEVRTQEPRLLFALQPVAPGSGALYSGVAPADARRIVDEHVLGGRFVTELIKRPDFGKPDPEK